MSNQNLKNNTSCMSGQTVCKNGTQSHGSFRSALLVELAKSEARIAGLPIPLELFQVDCKVRHHLSAFQKLRSDGTLICPTALISWAFFDL
jgi:hypothetical protein